jgi:hypothetical protein
LCGCSDYLVVVRTIYLGLGFVRTVNGCPYMYLGLVHCTYCEACIVRTVLSLAAQTVSVSTLRPRFGGRRVDIKYRHPLPISIERCQSLENSRRWLGYLKCPCFLLSDYRTIRSPTFFSFLFRRVCAVCRCKVDSCANSPCM